MYTGVPAKVPVMSFASLETPTSVIFTEFSSDSLNVKEETLVFNIEKPSDGFWKVWILRMQTDYSKIHFNMANPLQEQGPPFLLRMLSNRWQNITLSS